MILILILILNLNLNFSDSQIVAVPSHDDRKQQSPMPKLPIERLKLNVHRGIDKAYRVRIQSTEFNLDTILEHINSTFEGKQKALLILMLMISMDKQHCVTSMVTQMAAAMAPSARKPTHGPAAKISELFKCLAEFNELIVNLFASLISLIESNRLIGSSHRIDADAIAVAITTASNSNNKNNNSNYNCNDEKSKKFKHFLSHSKMTTCNRFHINTNNDNAFHLLVDRYDIVPCAGVKPNAFVVATIFISLVVRIVVIIVIIVVSFIILRLLFCVCRLRIRLLAKMWRMWCVLRLATVKAKMLRVLQTFCKANCVSAKLNAYKKREKRQDICSFSSYVYFPKSMIVVRMVQMLVKHDKNPASCTTQVSLDDNVTATSETNGTASSNADSACIAEVQHPTPSTSSAPASTKQQHHIVYVSGKKMKNKTNVPHRSVIASTASARSSPSVVQKNFVRVVKAPSQQVVQNVVRTIATKTATSAVSTAGSASIATDATALGKQISQNLFIYNTEGKIIRLTPVVGGNNNCFSTSAIDAMPVTTISSDINDTTKNFLSLTSKAPDFNAFVVTNAAAASTSGKQLLPNTRSIYEETYAKFLKSKESTVIDSVDVLPLKKVQQQATTIIQCHPLLKSGTVIANAAKPTTTNLIVGGSSNASGNSGANVTKQPFVGLSSIILKQLPKTVRPLQSFTFAKESPATAAGGTTKVQLIENVADADAMATGMESPSNANQFRITFPLVSTAGRATNLCTTMHSSSVSMPSQQLILTGASNAASQSRCIQSFERTKLIGKKATGDGRKVDHFTLEQLREFDMVLEQVKERSTTTTATTISTATSVVPTAAPEIIAGRRVSPYFAMFRPNSHAATNLGEMSPKLAAACEFGRNMAKHSETRRTLSQPIVVVATATCSPSNVNNVIISPAAVTNLIQQSRPTQSEQGSDAAASMPPTSEENKTRTKTIVEQQKPNTPTETISSTPTATPSTKPSNKSQEDEQTVQRIYDILAQYAEQISSSPDLNNKPAPRRRTAASKTSSTITTACLSSGNSSESSSQGTPSSTQTIAGKRVKSTSVSVSAESPDCATADNNDETDVGPEKRQRPNSSVKKSTCENRDYIITTAYSRSDQTHLSSYNTATVTNALKNNNTAVANRFVLSNGLTEPLTIGIPTVIDGNGNNNYSATLNDTTAMPNQTVNVLFSGNYLLPMGMIKSNRIGGNESVICSTTPTNRGANNGQILRPNLTTLMFSRNATNFQTDASNVMKSPILNNQKFQFQTIKMTQPKCDVGKTVTSVSGAGAATATYPSTILLPTITTHMTESKSTAIRSTTNDFHVDHTASAKFSPQIFQSNRGIIILNKKNATAVNSSAPVQVTVAATTTTNTLTSTSTPLVVEASSRTSSHTTDDFLLPLNQKTSSNSDDETSQGMPLSFVDESDPIFEEVVHQELLHDPPHQYHDQMYHNENDHEQVVIIDKKKSDALTLNSANRRHGDLHIKTRNDIERQLRLQKSLSEECEDLGVDEPSTSELFPEAELSFDNSSPIAFDGLSSHCLLGRNAFDFSNHRIPPSKVVKKMQKRNVAKDKHSNVFDATDSGSSKKAHFDEMPSIGLNHTTYKDNNDSDDSPMDESSDSPTNAYCIKNAVISDKASGHSTRIYREIRNTNKSNRLRKYGTGGCTCKCTPPCTPPCTPLRRGVY